MLLQLPWLLAHNRWPVTFAAYLQPKKVFQIALFTNPKYRSSCFYTVVIFN